MTSILSPVARLVQGAPILQQAKDGQGNPKLDKKTKQPYDECFIAIAIPKTDADFGRIWAAMHAEARASFPHLFDAQGNCTHPKFAWKYQDGDGVDQNGKSVADKPGFAGHHILKMTTRFAPRCYHHGKYGPADQIQNPEEIIKRGYWVRVNFQVAGNGVKPNDPQAVPGLFLSQDMIELVAFGDAIQSGPDAGEVFGGAAIGALPAGASLQPTMPAPAAPGMPAAPAAPGMPAAPAAPGMPAAPAAPGMPAAPSFTMTAAAQGATREALHAIGWTDDTLIAGGYMIRNG